MMIEHLVVCPHCGKTFQTESLMRSEQEIRERLKQCEVDYKLEKGFVKAAVIAGGLSALEWVLGDE